MAQVRRLLGKVRIEFIAIGLFLLTLVVFSARLYVCRFDGAVVAQLFLFAFPPFFGPFIRAVVLDACFATIGFMAFEGGFTKRAKLAFRVGFYAAAALFLVNLALVLISAGSDPLTATLYFGRQEFSGGESVLVGGFGLGFYLYILFLAVYGVAVFLHPGYAGTDEPTLWRFVLRRLNRKDPLVALDPVGDAEVVRSVPLNVFYTVITFGVWYYVWMYRMIRGIHKLVGEPADLTKDFLLSALVLPGIQVMYGLNLKKWETFLFQNRERFGVKKPDFSIAYLVLAILGLGVVATAMMQLDLNKAATVANATLRNEEARA